MSRRNHPGEWSAGAAGPLLSLLDEMTEEDGAWQDSALCAQTDGDLWFPEKGESTAAAKSICRRCPSRQPCLEYALDNRIRFGVWGALSERQRRDMLDERKAAA